MAKIGFFCQKRYDGGVRTGLGVGETTVLQHFQPGGEEIDPGLLWYVDLLFEGAELPSDAHEARGWLIGKSEVIAEALRAAADHLQVGLDSDLWPYIHRFVADPSGVEGEIRVSGVNRLSEGQLADELDLVADKWREYLEQLTPMVAV